MTCTALAVLIAGVTAPAAYGRGRSGSTPSTSGKPVDEGSHRARVPHELLVRWKKGVDGRRRAAINSRAGARRKANLLVPRLDLIRLPSGMSVEQGIDLYQRDPSVDYAEPNFVRRLEAVPDDPRFAELWALDNSAQLVEGIAGTEDADIDAPEAWDVTTGSAATIVAVVDDGIDHTHPDLAQNTWVNRGEVGSGKERNRVDDDRNGFVDDVRGWDFTGTGDNRADPTLTDDHGTHVAGTIGARGDDGVGIAGVSWDVRLMSLKVFHGETGGTSAQIADAFAYAGRMGARVVNGSFGGSDHSRAELDAIGRFPDTLFVFAAGNGGDDGLGDDNDVSPEYPCNYALRNVLCVAATNQSDDLAAFSNYGSASVHIAAPGTNILSTSPHGDTHYLSDGTSMAAPHVAGVASLMIARSPGADPASLRRGLIASVDESSGLASKVVSGGRLNARSALRQDVVAPSRPRLGGLALAQPFQHRLPMPISWTATGGPVSFQLTTARAHYDSANAWSRTYRTLTNTSTTVRGRPGFTYCFSVRAFDRVGNRSGLSRTRCSAIPVDDRSLTRSAGWKAATGTGHFLGTVLRSARKGATLSLRGTRARRVALVATKCPGCGTVEIYLGSRLLRRISLGSSRVRRRQSIGVATLSSVVEGTLRVRVVSSGRPVMIDGVGVSLR